MPIKLSEYQDKCMQQCAQCGVKNGCGIDIWICTRCQRFGYCSKSCQIAHLRVHRPVCIFIHQLYCPPKGYPAISHSHLVVASETHSDVERPMLRAVMEWIRWTHGIIGKKRTGKQEELSRRMQRTMRVMQWRWLTDYCPTNLDVTNNCSHQVSLHIQNKLNCHPLVLCSKLCAFWTCVGENCTVVHLM